MKHMFFTVLLAATLLTGCGPETPDGMPKLYPVQLTIVQEGTPLPEAHVALRSKTPPKFNSGGTTNEQGEITLYTHGQYKGVPEGEYVVLVSKTETIKEGPWDMVPKDIAGEKNFMRENAGKLKQTLFSVVDKKYAKPESSDLVINVTPKGIQETLDVGKPVRNKVNFDPGKQF